MGIELQVLISQQEQLYSIWSEPGGEVYAIANLSCTVSVKAAYNFDPKVWATRADWWEKESGGPCYRRDTKEIRTNYTSSRKREANSICGTII